MKEPKHDMTPEERPEEEIRKDAPASKTEKSSFWMECYTLLHDLVYILVFVTILFAVRQVHRVMSTLQHFRQKKHWSHIVQM